MILGMMIVHPTLAAWLLFFAAVGLLSILST
jgi:hypothetical protein